MDRNALLRSRSFDHLGRRGLPPPPPTPPASAVAPTPPATSADFDAVKNGTDYGAMLASWNGHDDGAVRLSVADRIYVAKGTTLLPTFAAEMSARFSAPVEARDFLLATEPSRLAINAWVADRTHRRITALLGAGTIDAETKLVLVNAAYFNGKWQTPFPARATSEAPFHSSRDTGVPTPTMHVMAYFGYAHDAGVTLVALPYGTRGFGMTIVLPDSPDGLAALEARMDGAAIKRWAAPHEASKVALALPRFGGDDGFSMRDGLRSLGVGAIFERDADFFGIGPDAGTVSDAVQTTWLRVDEKGTEAAAATAVAVVPPPRAERIVSVNVDHPFLFLLTDPARNVLFMGRVVVPETSSHPPPVPNHVQSRREIGQSFGVPNDGL